MTKPKIYAISDGRAGIERQAVAFATLLARELGGTVETHHLNPKPPQLWLPPDLWPAPLHAIPKEQRAIVTNPPDIWVANGRRSIPYSLLLKEKHAKTLIIQIQDPKIDTARFDYVIAPAHDAVNGKNVFETLGGLVWYSDKQIEKAKADFHRFNSETRKKILVILGGDSKTHRFSAVRASQIIKQLEKFDGNEYAFWITSSRRTPEYIALKFREFVQSKNGSFFESTEKDGENPYLNWLINADFALVTEDSANMLADCAFFEKPIHLLRLEGQSKKFDELHNSFIQKGAAIWFVGELRDLKYAAINSIENVAKTIAKSYQCAQNASK